MPSASGTSSFELSGNTLRIMGALGVDNESSLVMGLSELLQTGHRDMVVDLTGVTFMSSSYVRHLIEAVMKAKNAGRTIKVIACGQVVRLLGIVQLERITEVCVREPTEEQ